MSRPPLPARLLVPALAAVLGSASLAQPAPTSGAASTAAARPILDWDLPAGALDDTLARIARQSGKLISADPALVRGKTAAAVRGPLSAQDAAQSALRGSGLVLMQIGNDTWTVRPADTGAQAPAAPPTAAHSALPTVTIEGSRDPNQFYPAYTGGQVAKGARLGALGNTALLDAPFAISSYTEQAVRDAQARRLSDVLAIDPAVRSTNSESNSIDVFFLRGLPMLSQDISFNETFAVVDARRIAPEQLERIEVLKGPSALLNGIGPNSTTTGGTINLVPKRGTDVPLTRLTLLGSSHGQAGAHIDLGRRFGTDNRWGLRVNAMKREGDTGVQNEKTGTGHVSAALDYAGEKLRVSLDLAHNRRDFDGFAQLYRFNEGFRIPAPPSTGHTFAQPWDHSEGTSSSAVARVEYDFTPDSTVFGVLGGVTYRESNFTASSNRIVSASGNFTSMPTVFESDSTMRSGELGWRVRFDTGAVKHRVVLGYSRFAGDGDLLIRTFGSTLRSNLYNPVFTVAPTAPAGLRMQPSQDSSSDSVALMDSMHLLDDRLHLIAGLRYQRLNIGEFSGGRLVRRYDQQATAPSLAASYKLTPMLSVYGNYAEGLSQGPTAGGTTANAGAIFPPFKGKQLEAGLKYDAGPFGASAALFQIRQPVSYVNSSNYLVMDGEQSNRGLELSMYGQLSKQFRLNAGLALFDAVQSATLNGANDGKRAIGIPRYQLVLQGEWDVAQVPGLTLTGRFSKVARQMANADNTQSIPGFSQYDLGLRYATRIATRPTVLRLSLENAGNSSHWLGVRAGFLSRSTPRTLMLSVSTDF